MKKHHQKSSGAEPDSQDTARSLATIGPATDGINHINAHTIGKTELGRLLAHFTHTPFIHPFFGPFDSMEGFWYYMRSPVKDNKLRYMSGSSAKEYGKKLPSAYYDDFWEDIIAANYQKVIQNEEIHRMMLETTLPFQSYYLHGPLKVVTPTRDDHRFTSGLEEIRQALKENRVSEYWARAEKRYVSMITDPTQRQKWEP